MTSSVDFLSFPENPLRVIVTGWRAWPRNNSDFIWHELNLLWTRVNTDMGEHIPAGSVVIVHGACPFGGVDLYAEEWARAHRQLWDPHPAESRGGRFLGPERNAKMVALGADLCIGFPGPKSRGTWDCLEKATNAGIETYSKSWFEALNVKEKSHVVQRVDQVHLQ